MSFHTSRKLRLLAIGLPVCAFIGLELIHHFFLERYLPSLARGSAVFFTVLLEAAVFSAALMAVFERVYRKRKQQRRLLEAVHDAHVGLAAQVPADTALQKVVDLSRKLVAARYAALAVYEDGQLNQWFTSGTPSEVEERIGRLPEGEGLMGAVLSEGKSIRVKDIRRDIRAVGFPPDHPKMKSFLGVPIGIEGEVYGILYLTNKEGDEAFTAADEEVASMFATQAAVAVENALLLADERKQRRLGQTLREVAGVLSTDLGGEQILRRVLEQLARVVEYDSASLMLVTDGMLDLVTYRTIRGKRSEKRQFTPLRIDAFEHIREALDGRISVIIPDTAGDRRWQHLPGTESTRCWMGVPLVVQDQVIGLLNVGKSQPGFYTERDAKLATAFANQAAIAIENTRLYTEAKQHAAELATVLEAVRVASSTLELEEVLILITEQMVKAIDASGCTLYRWDREVDEIVIWIEWREQLESFRQSGAAFPLEDFPIARTVLREGEPAVFEPADWGLNQGRNDGLRRRKNGSVLMLPLAVRDQVIGLIELEGEEGRTFTEDQIRLCRALGAHAAIAIDNAQLFEAVRAGRERLETLSRRLVEVQEAERRQIARELHDEINQRLTGLKFILETSRRLPPEEAKIKLSQAEAEVNRLIAQVRDLSLGLRPSMLDDAGLLPALRWLFKWCTDQMGVKVDFDHDGLDKRFPAEVETAVYRIVQESLTNVARHARVSTVTVQLRAERSGLALHVEDDGAGFDPGTTLASGDGGGLVGMHERAAMLNARLEIDSSPGAGTRLTAEFPIGDAIKIEGWGSNG